jgi:acyl carrier protein phosphodiesterase
VNYLAHLVLADGSPDSIVGNLMGDFVKGDPEGRYPRRVVRGIRLHRAVDRFTDGHAAVQRGLERFPRRHRRFAGIALDMVFDHFLAARWQREAPRDFAATRRHAYAVLTARRAWLPERLRRILLSLRDDDWLGSYAHLEGITFALERMAGRLSRPNPLPALGDDIARHRDALEDDFDRLWPEARRFAVAEGRRLARRWPD